jgi:hypothetical protein
MEFRQNAQLKLATEFVQHTNKNIFLTGRAGTGKTTFLHNLKKITPKRMVVVAPTGVAAINAGGVTIHSFFQLSFAPAIPAAMQKTNPSDEKEGFKRKFTRDKIRLIKCIDLLVIDEISMVRADILDAVDEVLRKYRDRSKPFGGVQLLMIGDLFQLSPVIKDAEWDILKYYYRSVYFFDSLALKNSNPVCIELKEIFRQSDAYFIGLLNKIRDDKIDASTIEEINQRYIPGFKHSDDDGYITLTTHNANANSINQSKLLEIKDRSHFFKAGINGDFPAFEFPNEEKLELKTGAQVMFIRNDSAAERKYYNGKIGKITRIEDEKVYVSCPGESNEIEVGKVEWENVKYTLNDDTREIAEEVTGVFVQIPLKLAWAITIHKSQGLTFDKVIIDANLAFAYGQVYVALSRCRTFEGIVLSTRISLSGIKTDSTVANYSQESHRNEPDQKKLVASKKLFQQELIYELFNFKLIKYRFENLLKLATENSNIVDVSLITDLKSKQTVFDSEIIQVSDKFKTQLTQMMQIDTPPEENLDLQQRIVKAAAYFIANFKMHLTEFLNNISFEIDNKAIRKLLNESLEKFQKDVFIKQSCLENCSNGFETISYIRKRSDAELDFQPTLKQKAKSQTQTNKSIHHPELYAGLKQWRNQLAEENDLAHYMILPQKTMIDLTNLLPISINELKKVKGMGKVKIRQYGEEIINMIKEYCNHNDITSEKSESVVEEKTEKPVKPNTRKVSFEMFRTGKTAEEIAKERGLSVYTINGHLASFIESGDLKVTEVVDEEKIKKVLSIIDENPGQSVGEIKEACDSDISFSDLHFIIQHHRWLQKV